jgi:sugar phosphate isomerase/epimerase
MTLSVAAVELTALGQEFGPAVRRAAELGFAAAVVPARAERDAVDLENLADAGLLVAGAMVGGDLPADMSLSMNGVEARRQALELLRRQVADAARLGATWAYLCAEAGTSSAEQAHFADAFGLLAEYARRRQVRLCLFPAPGDAAEGVEALVGLPGAGLALDVAACRRAGRSPPEVAGRAGPRLGCIRLAADHLDRTELVELAAVLRRASFNGGIVVGLDDPTAAPEEALAACKALWEGVSRP